MNNDQYQMTNALLCLILRFTEGTGPGSLPLPVPSRALESGGTQFTIILREVQCVWDDSCHTGLHRPPQVSTGSCSDLAPVENAYSAGARSLQLPVPYRAPDLQTIGGSFESRTEPSHLAAGRRRRNQTIGGRNRIASHA